MPEMRRENGGAKTRRRYDEAFKRHAVELTMQEGRSVGTVAAELGLSRSMLDRWRRQFAPGLVGGGGSGPRSVEQLEEENRRLREELMRMRQREDVLKKSLGILSEPPARGMPGSNR